ncbi:response regulator [Tumidithrix elongata RA019]|uniref:Response regulator n=1 Tax=Tumidithrix elongata BACA0141 TaxID=2716417 RepID=A0AAW9PSE3_9CYAN|nr:response regulator [Tumidithrix elongata RA019]
MITVMVVDDIPSARELVSNYLREAGYQVISAVDGQEGLQKFEQLKPQVVITDLVMPGMSGLELCRAIKKSEQTVPVIACTSKNTELDRMWGLKQGINIYLTKPFKREELLKAVRSLTGEE